MSGEPKTTLRRRYRSNPFGLSQVKIIRELLEVFPPMWQSEIHEILEEADLPCTKGAVNTAVDQATRRGLVIRTRCGYGLPLPTEIP